MSSGSSIMSSGSSQREKTNKNIYDSSKNYDGSEDDESIRHTGGAEGPKVEEENINMVQSPLITKFFEKALDDNRKDYGDVEKKIIDPHDSNDSPDSTSMKRKREQPKRFVDEGQEKEKPKKRHKRKSNQPYLKDVILKYLERSSRTVKGEHVLHHVCKACKNRNKPETKFAAEDGSISNITMWAWHLVAHCDGLSHDEKVGIAKLSKAATMKKWLVKNEHEIETTSTSDSDDDSCTDIPQINGNAVQTQLAKPKSHRSKGVTDMLKREYLKRCPAPPGKEGPYVVCAGCSGEKLQDDVKNSTRWIIHLLKCEKVLHRKQRRLAEFSNCKAAKNWLKENEEERKSSSSKMIGTFSDEKESFEFQVSDEIFSIPKSILDKHKNSRLSIMTLTEDDPIYLDDRDKVIFGHVVEVLLKGKVVLSEGVSKKSVVDELKHFHIDNIDSMDIQEYTPPEEELTLDEIASFQVNEEPNSSNSHIEDENPPIEEATNQTNNNSEENSSSRKKSTPRASVKSVCGRMAPNTPTLASIGILTEEIKEQRAFHNICRLAIDYLLEHEIYRARTEFTIDLSSGVGTHIKDDVAQVLLSNNETIFKCNKYLIESHLSIEEATEDTLTLKKL